MNHQFRWRRRVEFAETDMAGIVHFATFFTYMEQCEHAFYRSLGFSVVDKARNGDLGWPRVAARCDYMRPFKFEDEMDIQLLVRRKGSKSLSYDFVFRLAGDDEVRARGALSVVCVSGDPAGGMKAVPLPAEIADIIEQAPEELLPS